MVFSFYPIRKVKDSDHIITHLNDTAP
jgi:hypothetical protein